MVYSRNRSTHVYCDYYHVGKLYIVKYLVKNAHALYERLGCLSKKVIESTMN